MKQNTRGRGELLSFLKDDTNQTVSFTQVSDVQKFSGAGGTAASIGKIHYELSGLDGNISEPIIVKEGNVEYVFEDIHPVNQGEALAESMTVRKS